MPIINQDIPASSVVAPAAGLTTLFTDSGAAYIKDPSNNVYPLGLTPSGVTPGAYTNASITVDTNGIITLASNGAGGADWASVDTNYGSGLPSNVGGGGAIILGYDTAAASTILSVTIGYGANPGSGSMNNVGIGAYVSSTNTYCSAVGASSTVAAIGANAFGANAYCVAAGATAIGTTTYNGFAGTTRLCAEGPYVGTILTDTYDATPTTAFVMNNFITGSVYGVALQAGYRYLITTEVMAGSNADAYAARLDFVVTVDNTNIAAITGTPSKTVIYQSAGASSWDINPAVNGLDSTINWEVTGDAVNTTGWKGSFTITQVYSYI